MSVNPEFYKLMENVTAIDLAREISATLVSGPKENIIKDIAPYNRIAPSTLVFQSESEKIGNLVVEKAIIITDKVGMELVSKFNSCIVVDSPRVGFAKALKYLIRTPEFNQKTAGASNQSIIASDAKVHPSAVLMSNVSIGSGTIIDAGAVIHPSVSIGKNCHIRSNVVLSHCIIGDNVEIGAGSIIGDEGFGFEMSESGAIRMPHIGLVQIENSVFVGSACAIDRGCLDNTIISNNVIIDNLCHIAHNVKIGTNSVISGQCGIS